MTTHVIVGGGLAGAHAAGALREAGFSGSVVLVTAESHPPYERPPLSKGYLAGAASLDSVFVHPPQWYSDQGVDLRLRTSVTALDLSAHQVTTGGAPIHYDKLLLATGSAARRLPMADASQASVAYLRTIEDADRLKTALRPGHRLAIIGGGWIGLEVAAAAVNADCDVLVVEPLGQPLLRVLGATIGAFFADLHRSHGVDLRTGTNVTGIESRPPRTGETTPRAGLHLDDETSEEADLVLVGIGAIPNTEVAEKAGLLVGDGVLTDELLCTSDPDVYAAGDVAHALHPRLGHRIRVEHWDNAIAQGATAARNMVGAGQAYDRLPYFFSDQYDLGMEYVGHRPSGGDEELVLRGDLRAGVFTALWLVEDTVVAALQANDWDATASMRALVGANAVDVPGLRDPAVPLDRLLPE